MIHNLLLDPDLSILPEDAENLLVYGSNLPVISTLAPEIEGKVTCIYLDPPYNTAEKFAHYKDQTERNTWLSAMGDLAKCLWPLLRPEGSLWVSIDDHEMAHLRVLLDNVLGQKNFVAQNVWQKRCTRENRAAIGDSHEYVLVYAKDPACFKRYRNKLGLSAHQKKIYTNPNNDPRGPWRTCAMTAQAGHATPSQFYEIVSPSGRVHRPPPGRCWGLSQKTFENLQAEGRIYFGKDGNAQPRYLRFLSEVEGVVPWTWWPHEEVGTTREAKKEVHALFGREDAFETPKPERLLHRIISIATRPGDLVLDPFAGTGTTGAVAHKMERRWLMIEQGEHCRSLIVNRLRKVIHGEDTGGVTTSCQWQGGGSFQFLRLITPQT